MEPIKTKMKYVFNSMVVYKKEETKVVRATKQGDEVIIEEEKLGWFLRFSGSQEKMYFGDNEPTLNLGDAVKITVERVE